MPGLFDGTPLERPVTCEACGQPMEACDCPRDRNGKVCLPADQPAVVQTERPIGAKVVTTIRGLDPVATDLRGLSKLLRSRCGAGGTIRDGVIEIQGDHRAAVAETLTAAGYPVKRRA